MCNEFGVYRAYADPQDRAAWIHDVRTALERHGMGWTMWDYSGSFGVVVKKDGRSVPDEVTLRALGLNQRAENKTHLLHDRWHGLPHGKFENQDVLAERLEVQITELCEPTLQVLGKICAPSSLYDPDRFAWTEFITRHQPLPFLRKIRSPKLPSFVVLRNSMVALTGKLLEICRGRLKEIGLRWHK